MATFPRRDPRRRPQSARPPSWARSSAGSATARFATTIAACSCNCSPRPRRRVLPQLPGPGSAQRRQPCRTVGAGVRTARRRRRAISPMPTCAHGQLVVTRIRCNRSPPKRVRCAAMRAGSAIRRTGARRSARCGAGARGHPAIRDGLAADADALARASRTRPGCWRAIPWCGHWATRRNISCAERVGTAPARSQASDCRCRTVRSQRRLAPARADAARVRGSRRRRGRRSPGAAVGACSPRACSRRAPRECWKFSRCSTDSRRPSGPGAPGATDAAQALPYELPARRVHAAPARLEHVHASGLRQFSASKGHGKTQLGLGIDALVWSALGESRPIHRLVSRPGAAGDRAAAGGAGSRATCSACSNCSRRWRAARAAVHAPRRLRLFQQSTRATPRGTQRARSWSTRDGHGEGEDAWVRLALRGRDPFVDDDAGIAHSSSRISATDIFRLRAGRRRQSQEPADD